MSSSVQTVMQTDPTDSWKQQWDQMLDHIKGMNAGDALMYVMYMMLPDVGNYLQGSLGQNAEMQNVDTEALGDWSQIQTGFNEYSNTQNDNDQSYAQQALDALNDLNSLMDGSNAPLSNIESTMDPLTEKLFQGSTDPTSLMQQWESAWGMGNSTDGANYMSQFTDAFSNGNSTLTGQAQIVQSEAQYIGNQLQEFFGEENSITSSETSGVTVMVNNENTN